MSQTNEEIVAEFEQLFGESSEEDDTTTNDPEPSSDNDEPISEESKSEESESEEVEETDETEKSDDKDEQEADSKAQKANEAFAALRARNKAQERLLQRFGKVFGFDTKDDPDQIMDKINAVLTEKEAKDQNIPVEVLNRLQELETIVKEKESNDRQAQVQDSLMDVASEFELDGDQLRQFTKHLIDKDLNPLEKDVDLKAEYLKLHWKDMLDSAKNNAIEEENERKKKAENNSASAAPAKKSDDSGGSDKKITTVKDLDAFLEGLDS